MKSFKLQWLISNDNAGKTVKVFLYEQNISKASLTDIKFQGGGIYVNDLSVTVRHVLASGEELVIIFPPEEHSEGIVPENIALNIVYEDKYLLVIDKPPFMNTIPSREHRYGSLASGLLFYYQQTGIQATVHIVTRLDRDTSGLILVAKHRHLHHLLTKQQIKRQYAALVHGTLKEDFGTITAPIARKKDSIIERTVSNDGQNAVTHFKVLKIYDELTYLSLRLETGRTHQIRVHMAFLGHPLVGDDLYGGSRQLLSRQALHSFQLEFRHPILNKDLLFESPILDDMKKLLK